MTEHTKTPWVVDEVRTQSGRAFRIGSGEMLRAGKGCCIIYDDHPGNPDNERAANAAFIVRSCNAHDELVAALKPLVFSSPDIPPPGVDVEDWRAAVQAARAALSRAGAE